MKIPTDTISNQNAMQVVEAGQSAILAGDCVIDFSGVLRCDTAAVACVLAWMRTAHANGRKLELIAVPKELQSLATLYGVHALINRA
ncbi:MAG TPA: STAS domain-containing protein [Burkholderiaceae bacterium]|nr:STAS domain-containing protein [Burkholderiaceae bacterium]HYA75697.1 STAS domain-containing protein [Burkholderiaceae bacterium]